MPITIFNFSLINSILFLSNYLSVYCIGENSINDRAVEEVSISLYSTRKHSSQNDAKEFCRNRVYSTCCHCKKIDTL